MKLEEILKSVNVCRWAGDLNIEVTDIQMDSRLVKPGCLFVAVKGTDERESLRDDLPVVARVGERLDIPRHARREDELAHDFAFGAEGIPFEHLSVFQRYIYFLIHAYLPLISSVCT